MTEPSLRRPERAVFLDRDGVINRAVVRDGRPYPPARFDDLEILPGVVESLHRLRRAGFKLIVVTNQPDVARGTQTRQIVEQMHRRLRAELPLDDIRTCYHDDGDQCACRKPKPGLVLEAGRDHGIDLASSYLVGDRWRDIDAGASAGCRTILITGASNEPLSTKPDCCAPQLSKAVDWILMDDGGRQVRGPVRGGEA